jgi:hypothetical protein
MLPASVREGSRPSRSQSCSVLAQDANATAPSQCFFVATSSSTSSSLLQALQMGNQRLAQQLHSTLQELEGEQQVMGGDGLGGCNLRPWVRMCVFGGGGGVVLGGVHGVFGRGACVCLRLVL